MKLLLTSAGLTNASISRALFELVVKVPGETSIVIVPTASNTEMGDKSWFINDLVNVKKQGFKSIAITDISAVQESIWRPQMEEADVILFEGGNTYRLMEWMNKSGFTKLLPEFLKSKVYVGISAGSMVTAPNLDVILSQVIYGEDAEEVTMPGLNLVDFYFLPHFNSEDFPERMEETIREAAKNMSKKVFALDDQSALKIVDGKVEVVSEGKWLEIN